MIVRVIFIEKWNFIENIIYYLKIINNLKTKISRYSSMKVARTVDTKIMSFQILC